jgi:hemolysin D
MMTMGMLVDASFDVLRRYGQVFRLAWSERRSLDPIQRTREELAFLPAHLELVESPPSPAPLWSTRIIVGLFTTALAWAFLGHLDIVAVAPGRTVTSSRTKVIQPAETSVVRRILVEDGQTVKKGDALIELDVVGAATDVAKMADALIDAKLTEKRTTALVRAMDGAGSPRLEAPRSLPTDRIEATQRLATSEFETFQAKRQSLEAMVTQKQAELRTVDASIAPLAEYADIARARVDDYKRLLAKKYVARQEYLVREQERINAERDLVAQRNHRTELLSAIAAATEQLSVAVADTRRQWLDEQRQASEQIRQLEPEAERTRQRDALMQLRAPVDGVVQQLAVHTIGGVVTPAQPLLVVVPTQEALEIEATVLNKDIGFVRAGQTVTVKVESFPYTRYGYLTGIVDSVSHDAAQDEKLGLVFPARIRLDSSTLDIDGVTVRLTPGMALSAEIMTGKRRVIDFLTGPLQQAGSEAMRER